jgi:hypothetical protein
MDEDPQRIAEGKPSAAAISSPSRTSPYWRRVVARALRDFWVFCKRDGLVWNLVIACVGCVMAMQADYCIKGDNFSADAWKAGVIGAIGSPIAVGLFSLLFYLVRATQRLDEERSMEAEALKQEIAAATPPSDGSMAAFVIDLCFGFEEIEREILSAPDPYSAPAWTEFDELLGQYKDSIKEFGSLSRTFHQKIYQRFAAAGQTRCATWLRKPLIELGDIGFYGEFDLDVSVSVSRSRIVMSSAGPRMVVDVRATNHESNAVNLLPVWHLDLSAKPIPHSADGESFPEWEDQRRRSASPALPFLPMPLNIGPGLSAAGYWSFLVRDGWQRKDEEPMANITSFLEVRDLLSRKRTKTEMGKLSRKSIMRSG